MAENTNPGQGIKDLGGLVNKDIAFSKLNASYVFDSQNFRISTNDGNTMAARETIKGTKYITNITPNPCFRVLTFKQELFNVLGTGVSYDIILSIDGTPLTITLTLLYNGVQDLIDQVTAFINANDELITLGIVAIPNVSNKSITLLVPTCAEITISSFIQTVGHGGMVSFPYEVYDEEVAMVVSPADPSNNFNVLNGYVDPPIWNRDFYYSGTNPDITSTITIGINDISGSPIDATATNLLVQNLNTENIVDEIFTGYNKAFENNLSGDIFPYFQPSSYNYTASFYVEQDANVESKITFYAQLGTTVTTFNPGLTIDTINGTNYVRIGQVIVPVATTTANYLGASQYAISFNYGAAMYGAFGAAISVGIPAFDHMIRVQADTPGSPPNTLFNFQFNLDYFKVRGPQLDFASFTSSTVTTIGTSTGYIIGWVNLRDDLYLFTTDGIFDPDDSSTGPFISTGQIWRFRYRKDIDYTDVNQYHLDLIYSSSGLNFTTHRPIANPGMIEARYESAAIQKIYWTDNYNVPRQINVADPNVSTLSIEDLNLQPSLSMDLPVVTEIIDGGDLNIGVYQIAYRLKNTNGSETRFSRTSNLIPIIDAQLSTATPTTYFPILLIKDNSKKSIKVTVDNLNLNYDTIEFVTIYYFDEYSEPEISIVKESFIPLLGSIEVIITGAEDPQIPITKNELTAFTVFFKRCKTLTSKKQTLFLANTTIADQEVTFDSRTYRYPINSDTTYIQTESDLSTFNSIVYDSINNGFYYEGVFGQDVPETHDCLQTYNKQGPEAETNYLYLPNSNKLGGKGPNITYEFYTKNNYIKLDNKNVGGSSTGAGGPHITPDTGFQVSFNSLDKDPYVADTVTQSDYSSPYTYDIYVGYRRDEMYRFGIVFFDEVDNPTYVNWIGDIRMPHIFMPDTTLDARYPGTGLLRSTIGSNAATYPYVGFSSSPTYFNTTTTDLYANPLGIKFTIDFSSIADKYKKAMIVRVALKEEYRHILGQGIFLPTFKAYSPDANDANYVFTTNFTAGNSYIDPSDDTTLNDIWNDCWTFKSPEFLFTDKSSFGNDSVDVLGLMSAINSSGLTDYLGGYYKGQNFGAINIRNYGDVQNQPFSAWVNKLYEFIETATLPASIKQSNNLNPYRVVHRAPLDGRTGGRFRAQAGSTLTIPGQTFTNPRIIANCSPRDTSGDPVGGVQVSAVGGGGAPDYMAGGYSVGNKGLFVQLNSNDATNWNYTNDSGNNYLELDGWNTNARSEYIEYLANYTKTIASPFGGQNYFSRSYSEYLDCKNLINISDKSNPIDVIVFGGDTVISVLDHVYRFFDVNEVCSYGDGAEMYMNYYMMPVETSIAIPYRRNPNNLPSNSSVAVPNRAINISLCDNVCGTCWGGTRIESNEHFEIDPVFNYTDKGVYKYFPKPALIDTSETFDCRAWRSERKTDGELVESWSIFKPESFLDVESAYGPINNLIVFQDKLFFFQDRGFGVLQVAEQKVITGADSDLGDLVLGSSGILERYDYISTKTGTKHQFSMSVSDYTMVWFDSLARKIYSYSTPSKTDGGLKPLTDLKGYSAYLYNNTGGALQTNDNPYLSKGVHSTYDFRHNEFYITFINVDSDTNEIIFQDTLVYNDLLDGFIGSYTHYPKVYINDKVNIFSTQTLTNSNFDSIYIHNYGDYGKFYDIDLPKASSISFVVNENPTLEKVFTNLEIVSESFKPNTLTNKNYNSLSEIDYNDFFNTLRVYNNYQNTDVIDTSVLSRKHKTIWNLKVPSDRVLDVNANIFEPTNLYTNILGRRPPITRKMKDKWFIVDLVYDNLNNNKLVIYSAKAIYSVNSR